MFRVVHRQGPEALYRWQLSLREGDRIRRLTHKLLQLRVGIGVEISHALPQIPGSRSRGSHGRSQANGARRREYLRSLCYRGQTVVKTSSAVLVGAALHALSARSIRSPSVCLFHTF